MPSSSARVGSLRDRRPGSGARRSGASPASADHGGPAGRPAAPARAHRLQQVPLGGRRQAQHGVRRARDADANTSAQRQVGGCRRSRRRPPRSRRSAADADPGADPVRRPLSMRSRAQISAATVSSSRRGSRAATTPGRRPRSPLRVPGRPIEHLLLQRRQQRRARRAGAGRRLHEARFEGAFGQLVVTAGCCPARAAPTASTEGSRPPSSHPPPRPVRRPSPSRSNRPSCVLPRRRGESPRRDACAAPAADPPSIRGTGSRA